MSNFQRKGTKGFTTGLLVILGTLCPYHANAAVLEEIIVTAQKREQNLQDVGISMSAFSGDQLSALGLTNSIDLARQTPGLTFSQEHPTLTALTIRGVSQRDLADHHEPPVATYVDGAYVSSMGAAHVQMFDLERVEVLRGPQGTLFGRNSTGGVLHYISRKPTSEFDAYGELTFAEYSQITFEGAIGGPITENVLGRFSVATDHHDGWMENRIGKDMNDAGTYTGRGQLLFKLGEKTDLLLKMYDTEDDTTSPGYNHTPNTYKPDGLGYSVGRDELATFYDFAGNPFQTCPGCDAHWYREPDADPRTGSFDVVGDFDRSITGSDGTLTIDFGSVTLTSITDYLHMDKKILEDVDGSPLTSVNFYTDQDIGQFSQELRLSGESERLSWITGFYYLNIDNHTASGLAPINIAPFIGLNFPGAFVPYNTGFVAQTDTESWAVFGHLEYAISDQWSVIAALRYTEDDKEADYTLTDDFGLVQHFNEQTSPNAKLGFENVSAKAELNWKPVENTLIYASYNRGHKAGSFNYPFIGPITDFSTLSHDEEVLTSYELGYKGDFEDGRIRLNVDLFYYDYNDYQAAFFVNFANLVGNVDATVHGGELELFMSPTDQLELVLGASWLDAKSKDVGMPDGSIQDRYMANAPDFTLNGLARYTWPLASGNVAIQVDGNYSDNFCFSVVCNYSEREGSYFISNARISYTTADAKWSFAAFVRNLNDTTYRLYTTDSAFVGFHTNMPNPPRWFGGTIAYHWR